MNEMERAGADGESFLGRLANARADRRRFLRASGAATAGLVLLTACGDDDDDVTGPGNGGNGPGSVTINFANDVGVLNYAYALEQLEAAFYIAVVTSPYTGMTAAEQAVLNGVTNHEIVHRDFLRGVLGNGRIADLTPDFSAIDFSSRASVLGTARVFEDLGVAAYNGAGDMLTNPDFLLVAGKIVSVEARHAAAIRDLLQPRSAYSVGEGTGMEDVVDANGLDRALEPSVVLAAAAPFIATTINVQGL